MKIWEIDIIVEGAGESVTIEWETDVDDEAELIEELMHYISIVPLRKIQEDEEE